MSVRYRLLGPLEALVDGEPAPLPGGKPRALLACLLLDPGRVVSVDTLAEALWTTPPASAHKVVQVYVSQLRKLVGKDAIETRAPGYRVPLADTDLAEFERLAEDAAHSSDPARGSEYCGRGARSCAPFPPSRAGWHRWPMNGASSCWSISSPMRPRAGGARPRFAAGMPGPRPSSRTRPAPTWSGSARSRTPSS